MPRRADPEARAKRPAILTDGRSPAPRAIGDLLIGLRKAGAAAIAPPVCAECGKNLRTLQRQGRDWYCSVCGQETAECTSCGNIRRVGFRGRRGVPRCKLCPDTDDRGPVMVVHELIAVIAAGADGDVIAVALRWRAPHRPTYWRSLVWAVGENSRLLTGEGCLVPSGRPINAWAMGEGLRKLGIRIAEGGSTALYQLATELPAAVLAQHPRHHRRRQMATGRRRRLGRLRSGDQPSECESLTHPAVRPR